MKKKLFFIIIFTLITLEIFMHKDIINMSVLDSMMLWKEKVFPSLFIMFIISDIFLNYDIANVIYKIMGKLLYYFFRLTKNGQAAFILSFIAGTPVSAHIITTLYLNKEIEKKEAEHLLKFTYFPNPLFLYSIYYFIFNNNIISIKMICIVYFSNILLAYALPKNFKRIDNYKNNKIESFSKVLVTSIKKSINNLILILGSITFFMIISNLICYHIENEMTISIIKGVLEITNGLNCLSVNNINKAAKYILTGFITSFGGFSIHTQVISMLEGSNLSYKHFFMGRIYSSIITVLLILIILL